MTYGADTTDKRSHRVGYFLALDGIPTRFATHRFDELVQPNTQTAWAWWALDEATAGASVEDRLGQYPLTSTGVGTPDPRPSFLQPSTESTGSRYFSADYDIREVNSNTIADAVIERGSLSAGFRPDSVAGTEVIFAYSGVNLGTANDNNLMTLSHVGDEMRIEWRDAAAATITSTTSGADIVAGVPYHVMVTWQTSGGATDLTLYLWEVGKGLIHEESWSGLNTPFRGTSSTADFVLGSTRIGTNPYDGFLEDVVLWRIRHSRDTALAYLQHMTGSIVPALDVSGLGISGSSLDRARSLVVPGGFSCRVMDGTIQREVLSRREGVRDELSASVSASATTIATIGANNDAGRVVYLERESIITGPKSGTSYTLCQRGAWGSQPRAHGATLPISSRPRYLAGRRGVLWAVDLDTMNAQALRAGLLGGSPQFADGAYDLEFVDVQKELNRPLMRGFQTVTSADWVVNGYAVDVTVPDARLFVDGTRSSVRVDADDANLQRIHYLDSGDVDTGTNVVTLDLGRITYNGFPNVAVNGGVELELRQVQIVVQDAAIAALQIMCSILGDGANGSYDVLPGRAPGADFPGVQVGAGIPEDWVDVAAWEALEGIGGQCVFYLEEETRLLDFLVNEIAWRLGGYVYVTGEGKISFQRYRAAVPAIEANSLAKADILAGSVSVLDDESETIGRVSIECNFDPGSREFLSKQTIVFADLMGTYGDDLPAIELQSTSLWIGGSGSTLSSPPSSQWELISSFDRIYSRTKDGVRKVRFRLPWQKHTTYLPGYTFKLTDDRLPDFAGDVGISSRTHEVISASPDPTTGALEVEAEEIPKGFVIAPTAIVASYNAGTGVATLDTTTDYHGSEPGFDFPVGADIIVFDADATPTFSVSQQTTITAVTASTMTFSSSGFTPAAGDIITLFADTLTSTNVAANTLAGVKDHLYQTDANDQIGAANDEGTKLA